MATNVDLSIGKQAVRTIGFCALRLEHSVKKCISTLLELIKSKNVNIVQEAVIIITDIFRRYPTQYTAILSNICESLDNIDSSDGKRAIIWIIGEYSDIIANAVELLNFYLENMDAEPTNVQEAFLTASIKAYLHNPDSSQDLIASIMNIATASNASPDLRDRGYFYKRLIKEDTELLKKIVLSPKPEIESKVNSIDSMKLTQLLPHLCTASIVTLNVPNINYTITVDQQEQIEEAVEEDEAEEEEQQHTEKHEKKGGIYSSSSDEDESSDEEDDKKQSIPNIPSSYGVSIANQHTSSSSMGSSFVSGGSSYKPGNSTQVLYGGNTKKQMSSDEEEDSNNNKSSEEEEDEDGRPKLKFKLKAIPKPVAKPTKKESSEEEEEEDDDDDDEDEDESICYIILF